MQRFGSHLAVGLFIAGTFLFSPLSVWSDDIEIDLSGAATPAAKNSSPSSSVVSQPVTSGAKPTVSSSSEPKAYQDSGTSISNLNISTENQGFKASFEGKGLPKPVLEKLTNKKLLLKFEKTGLKIPKKIDVKNDLIKDVRSSMHDGTAWVVLDLMDSAKTNLEQTDLGYALYLNGSKVSKDLPLPETSSAPAGQLEKVKEKEGSFFSRLIDASLKPVPNGIKLVLTSDGPSKYTVRKLSQPEKLIIHFHDTKLEIADKLKKFKSEDVEFQKGGLLSVEFRQLSPALPPISEVMLTIIPGTIHQIDRDLNQVVITLTAPPSLKKPEEKKGNLNQLISMDLESADLNAVIKTLVGETGFEVNFVSGPLVGVVTEKFKDIPFKTALADLLSPGNYDYDLQGNTLRIGSQAAIQSTKKILPHLTELITPSGGMSLQPFDGLVRNILPASNASSSFFDTTRNVIVLNGTASDIEEYKKAIKDLKLDEGTTSDRITRIVKLNYADAANLNIILTPYLTPVGKVQVIGQKLVIWETATNMGVLLELINELDHKPAQVLIESTIVEVDNESDLSLGVQWTANRSIGDPTLSASVSAPAVSSVGLLTFGTLRSGLNISATLSAIVTNKKGKVISRPRVATQSGIAAEIQETENVIISSTTQTSVPNVGIQTVTTFTQLGLPIDLKVTPRITDDGHITTIISASITSQSGPALGPSAPPPTNIQTATTTLTTKNGETIVIGGLVREVAQDTVNGIPLLSSIPIIGTLFQDHEKTNRKEELIIFITPTLLED